MPNLLGPDDPTPIETQVFIMADSPETQAADTFQGGLIHLRGLIAHAGDACDKLINEQAAIQKQASTGGLNKIVSVLLLVGAGLTCFSLGASPYNVPSVQPEPSMSLLDLAKRDCLAGNYTLSIKTYRKLLTEGTDPALILFGLAQAEYGAKNYEVAIEECNRSIALKANLPDAYMVRGISRLERKDKDGKRIDIPGAKADLVIASELGNDRAKAMLLSPVLAGGK